MNKIELNLYPSKKFGVEMSERTYQRGLRELLENEFLYRSPSADVFFVNILYMFNGNRITLAKSSCARSDFAPLAVSLKIFSDRILMESWRFYFQSWYFRAGSY